MMFSELPEDVARGFYEAGQTRTLKKGEHAFIQHDPAQDFYLILSGWVKLYRETLDGDEAVLDVMTGRHIFGESALFEKSTYPFSAVAVEDTQVLAFPFSYLTRRFEDTPAVAIGMLRAMSRYRAQQTMEIEHRTLQSAPQRIGCFLLRLVQPQTTGAFSLTLPYDKTLLASRLGMKPETFSRALSRLKDDLNLKVVGPTIEIPDIENLADFACSACSASFPCDDLTGRGKRDATA